MSYRGVTEEVGWHKINQLSRTSQSNSRVSLRVRSHTKYHMIHEGLVYVKTATDRVLPDLVRVFVGLYWRSQHVESISNIVSINVFASYTIEGFYNYSSTTCEATTTQKQHSKQKHREEQDIITFPKLRRKSILKKRIIKRLYVIWDYWCTILASSTVFLLTTCLVPCTALTHWHGCRRGIHTNRWTI